MINQHSTYLTIKDHSVSGEEFQLLYNEALDMLETFPQPKGDKLSGYYKSEDYISHTDTKRNILEYVYHYVRQIALKQKLKLINSFNVESQNMLDIGCGTGDFLETALKANWTITGIEPNANAREIANAKTNNSVFKTEHLEKLNNLQKAISGNLTRIGAIEFDKQKLILQVENLNSDLEDFKLELEKEYGPVTIDLATGEYKLIENGTDTKD